MKQLNNMLMYSLLKKPLIGENHMTREIQQTKYQLDNVRKMILDMLPNRSMSSIDGKVIQSFVLILTKVKTF